MIAHPLGRFSNPEYYTTVPKSNDSFWASSGRDGSHAGIHGTVTDFSAELSSFEIRYLGLVMSTSTYATQ